MRAALKANPATAGSTSSPEASEGSKQDASLQARPGWTKSACRLRRHAGGLIGGAFVPRAPITCQPAPGYHPALAQGKNKVIPRIITRGFKNFSKYF